MSVNLVEIRKEGGQAVMTYHKGSVPMSWLDCVLVDANLAPWTKPLKVEDGIDSSLGPLADTY
jgi:hypothetical protein